MESETQTPEEQPSSEGAVSMEVEDSKGEVVPKKSKQMKKPNEGKAEEDEEVGVTEAASSTGAVPKKSKKHKKAHEGKPSTSSGKANASKPANRSILQLKVTLLGISPPIWRRIQVLNNDNFDNLRQHIDEAMGWCGAHSYQFIIHNPKKDSSILIVNGVLDGLTYDFSKEGGRLLKGQTTKLSKFLTAPGDVIMYEYDLGDSWMHHINVEKILPPPPPKAEYPKCTGGKRACPPDDCGGVDGYKHLLEVYKNPQHEEYEDLITGWLEDMSPGFDPEKFDRKKVFRKVWMWVDSNNPGF